MRKDNTHMDHFEDRIVLAKKNPIHWIDDICADKVTWSRKWDGAPSIFVGRDEDGIFVAKKGIFNKNPKLYRSSEDIKNLIVFKKAIFQSNFVLEDELLKSLKPSFDSIACLAF